jgi:hypothetical protein
MRTVVLSILVLLAACGDKRETAARDMSPPPGKLEVVDVMPAFWAIVDAQPAPEPAARAARFEREVVKAHPGLYGPVIPHDPEFSVPYYFDQLAPLLPGMREITPLMRQQIDAGLVAMRARFGRLSDLTVYIAPSLFTSNGQVRVVGDQPVVMFGVDVQAYAELELLPRATRNDMRAYILHELFHAHHYGVNPALRALANTLFDEQNPAPLHVNLWIEGLATCVSMSLDGDGTIERALMSERLPGELPPVLSALAREVAGKLDSRSLVDTRDLFWLGGERKDIPPRSAYAIGALIADDVILRRGLEASLKLSGDELRAEVARAVATLSNHSGSIDWSAVCATSTL